MTLIEIKTAVDKGLNVHWVNTGYIVIKDCLGQYLLTYKHNDFCIGLTWNDGVTLNGAESEFFIGE